MHTCMHVYVYVYIYIFLCCHEASDLLPFRTSDTKNNAGMVLESWKPHTVILLMDKILHYPL